MDRYPLHDEPEKKTAKRMALNELRRIGKPVSKQTEQITEW